MPVSPYFTTTGPKSEQNLLKDLYSECIKQFGQDFYYIPRDTVNVDELFGEDIASNFKNAYPIEMMVENVEGYDGQDLFQKFGVEIRDEATLIVAKHRFYDELISTPHRTLERPREGDLLFLPFSNSLFEIMFVEHELPFYIWNELPAFKFNISLFEYNQEDIDVDVVGLDKPAFNQTPGQGIEATNYTQKLTLASSGAYILGEEITQLVSGVTVTGEIVKIDGAILYVSHIRHDDTTDDYQIFSTGSNVTGSTSAIVKNVTAAIEVMFDFAKNDEIETIADAVLDFQESNPFGEP